MNILDENLVDSQRRQLLAWRIRVSQIGYEVGRKGMDDRDGIVPLLHHLRQPTFFTRDADFYDRRLRHPRYCIVCLRVGQDEVAETIRRFLRHPAFNTHAKRSGQVVRIGPAGITFWQVGLEEERALEWSGIGE